MAQRGNVAVTRGAPTTPVWYEFVGSTVERRNHTMHTAPIVSSLTTMLHVFGIKINPYNARFIDGKPPSSMTAYDRIFNCISFGV
jgi:hypothetical protein